MTLLQRYLAHYIEICQRGQTEKANAWQLAKDAAKNYPEHLAELPQMLTDAMLKQKKESTTLPASTPLSAESTAMAKK